VVAQYLSMSCPLHALHSTPRTGRGQHGVLYSTVWLLEALTQGLRGQPSGDDQSNSHLLISIVMVSFHSVQAAK
jgi:hypothetical protein